MNEIANTRVGDSINYFVNGVEDTGMVVKMNNSYITIVKNDGSFKDIQINETFFVKDIIINKTWNDMNDGERLEALSKAHVPSPRYVTKTWDQLPKELQTLLTKNNGIESSAKDGKDDDMNETKRIFDKSNELNSRNQKPLDSNSQDDRSFGEIRDQEGTPRPSGEPQPKDKALSGDSNYKRTGSKDSDHASSDAMSTSPKSESGGFKLRQPIGSEGASDHGGHGKTGKTRQQGVREREPSAEEQKGEQRGTTQTQEQSDDNKKELATSSVRLFSGYNEQTGEKEYKDKTWTELIEEVKSNVETSIHGNAGRNPNAGVNTSTNFDAPEDYEGASHSGIRLEQFKHENLKPKVKEQIDLGDSKPSDVQDGGNKYDTKTQPKTINGRVVDQEKDKKI